MHGGLYRKNLASIAPRGDVWLYPFHARAEKAGGMKKGAPSLKRPGLLFFPFPKVERLLSGPSMLPARAKNSTGEPLVARALPSYSHERTT